MTYLCLIIKPSIKKSCKDYNKVTETVGNNDDYSIDSQIDGD